MDNAKITIIIESPCKDKSLLTKDLIMQGIKNGFTDLEETKIEITIE